MGAILNNPSLSKVNIVAQGSLSYICAAGATWYDALAISLPVITDKLLFVDLRVEGTNFPQTGLGLVAGNNAPDIVGFGGVTIKGGLINSSITCSKIDPSKLNLITDTAVATGALTRTYTTALAKDLSTAKTAYIKAYSDGADTIKITYNIYYLSN